MGLEILALGLILTMRVFPQTEFGRLLHLHLVELPMIELSKLERHHLLFLMIVIAILFAGSEVIAILGSTDMVLSIAWDMSLYFDAVAVAALVTGARQIRIAVRLARVSLRVKPTLPLGRRRRREVKTQSSAFAKANDDDPHRAFAIAA